MTTERIDSPQVAPDAFGTMLALQRYVGNSPLEPSLLELVKIRASQINGCATCLDMHTKDSRAEGESEQRLYLLSAWRDAPFFSARERAALLWAEALTLLSRSGVSAELYAEVGVHFSEAELIDLTMAIVAINGWNRLTASFRPLVGEYEPPRATKRFRTAEGQ